MKVNRRKPHLIAVHLDRRAPEFRPAVRLWERKNSYAGRIYISSKYHPNPFGREGAEISSSSGKIAPGSLPPAVSEPNFVLIGGLLSGRACLSRALTSLVAMGSYTAGQVSVSIPRDAVYANGPKEIFAEPGNPFNRPLRDYFGDEFKITLNGTHLHGNPKSPAELHWWNTAKEMFASMWNQLPEGSSAQPDHPAQMVLPADHASR